MTDFKDMPETWITNLEADLNVLNHLVDDYELAGASDKEVAVAWTVRKLNPPLERIKDYLYQKWHDERSGWQASTPAVKPAKMAPSSPREAGPTIRDLCHQWEIVAKLALELLERGHEQETVNHLCEPAEARWREIERAILDTDPATIRDVDFVEMLRLARKIIGNDQYATSEDAAEAMLELIDSTLTRRMGPKNWGWAA